MAGIESFSPPSVCPGQGLFCSCYQISKVLLWPSPASPICPTQRQTTVSRAGFTSLAGIAPTAAPLSPPASIQALSPGSDSGPGTALRRREKRWLPPSRSWLGEGTAFQHRSWILTLSSDGCLLAPGPLYHIAPQQLVLCPFLQRSKLKLRKSRGLP